MGKFAFGVFINRSPQDVFDFLTDPANLSKWNASFESAAWASSAAPGPGSTYHVSAKMLGSKKEGLFEIVQWDRPNGYSYQMNQRAFPIEQMRSTVLLEPKNNGTQVIFEAHFELAGILKFAESFFAGMGKKQDGRNFESAKKILEAGF